MLNGRTGKKMKRKKTRFLHAVAQPEFNETLAFDLAASQLDTVQFLAVLCSKVRELGRRDKVSGGRSANNSALKRNDSSAHRSRVDGDILHGGSIADDGEPFRRDVSRRG